MNSFRGADFFAFRHRPNVGAPGPQSKQARPSIAARPVCVLQSQRIMVGVARIELATPAMSTQCSTTELHAHEVAGCSRGCGRMQALSRLFRGVGKRAGAASPEGGKIYLPPDIRPIPLLRSDRQNTLS